MLRGIHKAVFLSTLVATVLCNFECVCIYHAQPVTVYDKDLTTVLGTVNNHECKATAQQYNTDIINWVAIVYNMKLGYIRKVSKIEVDVCQGEPTALDILNTSSIVITSTSTTSTTPVTSTTELYTVPTTSTPVVTTDNSNPCTNTLQQQSQQRGGVLGHYGHVCYELLSRTSYTWSHGESVCTSHGGHLVYIGDEIVQQYILQFLKEHSPTKAVWIGLSDRTREGHFKWSTGDTVNYTHWIPGHASNFLTPDLEDCVVMVPYKNGLWDDIPCGDKDIFFGDNGETHPIVCEYRTVEPNVPGTITTNPPVSHTGNTDGNVNLCAHIVHHSFASNTILGQFKNACFQLFPTQKVAWQHADSICKGRGGFLVSISNAEEQTFIQSFMSRHLPTKAVWIGLSDTSNEDKFKWSSGINVTYYNWIPGHVSNFLSHVQEDCVLLLPYKGGQWDDVPCGREGVFGPDVGESHPFICQHDVDFNAGNIVVGK